MSLLSQDGHSLSLLDKWLLPIAIISAASVLQAIDENLQSDSLHTGKVFCSPLDASRVQKDRYLFNKKLDAALHYPPGADIVTLGILLECGYFIL